MKYFLSILLLLYLAPLTTVRATELTCGATISEDIELETNLDCRNTNSVGLVIGSNDIVLDLNGFTIAGDASAPAAIFGDGYSGIDIENGAIYGFQTGIYLRNATDVSIDRITSAHQPNDAIAIDQCRDVRIEDVQISQIYDDGGQESTGVILFESEDVKVENITAEGGFYGLMSLSSKNVAVKDNSFTKIAHVGVRVVNNRDTLVENNRITGVGMFMCYSAVDVVDPGPSNRIKIQGNVLTECSHGVFAAVSPPESPTKRISVRNNRIRLTVDGIVLVGIQDSEVVANRVHLNGSGIGLWEHATNNRIAGNLVTGNVLFDVFHDESSVPNTWTDNTCVLTNGMEDIDCP